MDGNQVLASALVKMATSPVKADRDAIARLERECGTDITLIATALEDSQIVFEAMSGKILFETMNATNGQGKVLKILVAGLFWSSVIGVATMFIRPNYVWCGVSLGFIAGVAGRMEPFKN